MAINEDRFEDDGEGIEIMSHPDPEIEKRIKDNLEKAKKEENKQD
ncbi:hypothetical protein [Xylanibacillus composti]|uniref:Uncharacterized protein n=1 Tax=Xylanibacillus composti TaxID=1572762 RepID=A0A8J4H0S6_9BACL|nr:hypothetical protein [Xylanibacillus composti]GIQ67450.1 hypothetical protein XYCOK13_02740 [Xylanibacillus composti]